MIGSTRPSVSVVARHLKKEKLIDYRRGVVTILDRKGLEERACECYLAIRERATQFCVLFCFLAFSGLAATYPRRAWTCRPRWLTST